MTNSTSTTQFLETKFGYIDESSAEDNAARLLKVIKKEPGIACEHLYQAVVRLGSSGVLTRMIKASELKALREATICAKSKCADVLQPSLDALADALQGYFDFFDGAEDGRIRTANLFTGASWFSDHPGCGPLHNLHRHKTHVIEELREVTREEIQRFWQRHPHFAHLDIPAYFPSAAFHGEARSKITRAIFERHLNHRTVFGVERKTATTSLVSMTACSNKVYLGRSVNNDEYIAVKLAGPKSNLKPLCPSEKTVDVLMESLQDGAKLYALFQRPSGILVSAMQLGLANLVPVLEALKFVRWLFLEGRGALDTDRLSLLAEVAKSRYERFPERTGFQGEDAYSRALVTDLKLFSNPVNRFQYTNELGRRVINAVSDFAGLGLAHQDIKPANMMVFDKGSDVDIALVDYDGVVRVNDSYQIRVSSEFGTPGYIDPQRLPADDEFQSRQNADLFSTGIILREIAGARIDKIFSKVNGYLTGRPIHYPTFSNVVNQFLCEGKPTHLYHVALLLSGKLECYSTGEPIRTRFDHFNYIKQSQFFRKNITLDEDVFRQATLSLIKLGLSLTGLHLAKMECNLERRYGTGRWSEPYGELLLSQENHFAKMERLSTLRTVNVKALEQEKAWPMSKMMPVLPSTNGSTQSDGTTAHTNRVLVSVV